MYHKLKGGIFTVILKGLLLAKKKKHKLSIRHQKALEQVFQQSFNHVVNLKGLINSQIKYDAVITELISEYFLTLCSAWLQPAVNRPGLPWSAHPGFPP